MQQKVFRVEQLFAGGRARQPQAVQDTAGGGADSLKRELAQIHDMIARNKGVLSALVGDGRERKMARAAGELGAAIEGMEKATDKILKSVEVVDDSAKALTASLKDDYKRGLAQDIQDHVVKIYEACNFQDLAGQRIVNVIRTLNLVEEQVAAMLERFDAVSAQAPAAAHANSAPAKSALAKSGLAKSGLAKPVPANSARGLINGPKLDGDIGHASQLDVDEMFG